METFRHRQGYFIQLFYSYRCENINFITTKTLILKSILIRYIIYIHIYIYVYIYIYIYIHIPRKRGKKENSLTQRLLEHKKQNDRVFNSTGLLKNWTSFTFIGLIDTVPVPILISSYLVNGH